jgi:hypothetical protein
MVIGTFFTLFVVPAIYLVVAKTRTAAETVELAAATAAV